MNINLQSLTRYFETELGNGEINAWFLMQYLMADFVQLFCFLILNFYFPERDWALGYDCTQFWVFLEISFFTKILSLKLFSNSYIHLLLEIIYSVSLVVKGNYAKRQKKLSIILWMVASKNKHLKWVPAIGENHRIFSRVNATKKDRVVTILLATTNLRLMPH